MIGKNGGKYTKDDPFAVQSRTQIRHEGNLGFWFYKLPALDLEYRCPDMLKPVTHHEIEKPLAKLFFKVVGRVDRDKNRPGIKTMSAYLNCTPYTKLRGLRMRAELLFCRPMDLDQHISLHQKLRWLKLKAEKAKARKVTIQMERMAATARIALISRAHERLQLIKK